MCRADLEANHDERRAVARGLERFEDFLRAEIEAKEAFLRTDESG